MILSERAVTQPAAYLDALDAYLHDAGIRWFTAQEVCPVGTVNGDVMLNPAPDVLWPNVVRTLRILDDLREHLGKPVIVTSGYRGAIYNEAVGGAPDSLHVQFAAIDFYADEDPLALARWLHAREETADLGLGLYADFVHADTRGMLGRPAPARWPTEGDFAGWWKET